MQSYGVMLPKNKPSSFCLKLFLTMDEFRIILEYCGLIKGDHLGTGKQKTFGKDLLLYDLVPGVYVVYYYVGSLLHSSQYLYLHKVPRISKMAYICNFCIDINSVICIKVMYR